MDIGFTVLELSKWFMYDLLVTTWLKRIDAELLFTDTEGLTYEIRSENVYEEFLNTNIFFI